MSNILNVIKAIADLNPTLKRVGRVVSGFDRL